MTLCWIDNKHYFDPSRPKTIVTIMKSFKCNSIANYVTSELRITILLSTMPQHTTYNAIRYHWPTLVDRSPQCFPAYLMPCRWQQQQHCLPLNPRTGGPTLPWAPLFLPSTPGPRFNIKMSSYQHRKSHCGDKTVVRSSYIEYWIRALEFPVCDLSVRHRSPDLQPTRKYQK